MITSLSTNSASPVLKGTLFIYGNGFGTTRADLAVYLVNSTGFRVYQLNILDGNDTSLKVKLSGGVTGAFKASVVRAGYGSSTESAAGAADFKYEIVVTGVAPATAASRNGGTVLTVTGRNFSPDPLDNQVYVSDEINWFCLVLTATATQLTCRAPPVHSDWTNLTQHVVVVGRVLEDSSCEGTCTLTYDNVTYPTIVAPATTNYSASVSVTLSGQRLINGGVNPIVTVGDTVATVQSATSNSVTFLFPEIYSGTYDLNVYVNGIGYAEPTIEVTV